MSKKTELLNTLNRCKAEFQEVSNRIQAIRKSEEYTTEGKDNIINRIKQDFSPAVVQYHDRAIEIIENGLSALNQKWKSGSTEKLMDSGYQMGLSNIIKMLEMGVIRNEDDIKNIIEIYKEDYNAIAIIKEILLRNADITISGYANCIPKDNREKNKELLKKLIENINNYISIEAFDMQHSLFNVSLALDGSILFLESRFNDDLELVA